MYGDQFGEKLASSVGIHFVLSKPESMSVLSGRLKALLNPTDGRPPYHEACGSLRRPLERQTPASRPNLQPNRQLDLRVTGMAFPHRGPATRIQPFTLYHSLSSRTNRYIAGP